jgi:hypothetical protein
MSDGRQRVKGIISALEDARQDLLDYRPPWVESSYEDMLSAVDRKLRSVQLGIANLADEIGKAPTEPPAGDPS